jgi:hypothetical protein
MFFEGQRIRAVCDVPARSFLDRHVLKGLTYEVAEFADLLGLPSVKLKGDAPDRWIPARAFEPAPLAFDAITPSSERERGTRRL